MKLNYFQQISISLLICSLFGGLLFGDVLKSHAQSSQIWSDPINLSNAGSSTDPEMIIDTEGTIHVVWIDEFDGYKYVQSSDGVEWTSPVTVTFPFSPEDDFQFSPEDDFRLRFYIDKEGGIYALWVSQEDNELYYSDLPAGSDFKSGWTDRIKIDDSVIDFEAKVSSQGILHVGYVSSFSTDVHPAGVYYFQISASSRSGINIYSSKYFRSLQPEDANVHLTVSETNEHNIVYMVWDDSPLRQAYYARSLDGGTLWEDAIPIRDWEDKSITPFNINVGVFDDNVLLMWQDGIPGSQCTLYSQWFTDGAEQFTPPVKVLDELAGCPQSSEFLIPNQDFSLVLLNIPNNISFVAWNGQKWSTPQVQNGINNILNPATLENVILGCQKVSSHNGRIFVVGCDSINSGDIWFTSRTLGSIESWFPPPSMWSSPRLVANSDQTILSLSLIADMDNTHLFWIQSSQSGLDELEPSIKYSGFNGNDWSSPVPIISKFTDEPFQLYVTKDWESRILITWLEAKTGELFFSWANAERPNLSGEWAEPQVLPTFGLKARWPVIYVDNSGTISIAYVVPLNEGRGVYLIQSNDSGQTWMNPLLVFDAENAGWEMVGQPSITGTMDGKMQIMWTQNSLPDVEGPVKLYYVSSEDGGLTWSTPEDVIEAPVVWYQILGYGDRTVHRFWQEINHEYSFVYHQVSYDGGSSWNPAMSISSNGTALSVPVVTSDDTGQLRLLQIFREDNDNAILHNWQWDGKQWYMEEVLDIGDSNGETFLDISANVSSKGNLEVIYSIPDVTTIDDDFVRGIYFTNRYVGDSISTPTPPDTRDTMPSPTTEEVNVPATTSTPTLLLSPTLDTPIPTESISNLDSNPSASGSSNKGIIYGGAIAGFILTVIFGIFIFRRFRSERA